MTSALCSIAGGAGVKMEHFQAALDPRKQELLEARFLGARVSFDLIQSRMSGKSALFVALYGVGEFKGVCRNLQCTFLFSHPLVR